MKDLLDLIAKDNVVSAKDFFVPSEADIAFIKSINEDFNIMESSIEKQSKT